MAIAAVIVTHRSERRLGGLLEDLRREEPSATIVVVDSGSPEGPPPVPADVPLVALARNVGFGAACNAGAAHPSVGPAADLAFLNPDVRLHGSSLSEISIRMTGRTGIATGTLVDPSGEAVAAAWGPTSASRAFWFGAGWKAARARRWMGAFVRGGLATSAASMNRGEVLVDGHVLGGAMVVRRECWEHLGGFDEEYFLYWEDADLCHRARQLGWEVRVLPCTPIVHEAGTSSTGVIEEQRWQWYVDGADTFARKHLTDRERRRLLAALRWGRRLRR